MNAYQRAAAEAGAVARDPTYAYVNNLIAASSCTLLVTALHLAFNRHGFNYWTVMRCVQGMLAGVIIVSAAANDYSPQVAIAMGCLGGVLFYFVSKRVFRSALEDYCNVVAMHFTCALLGSVLAPLCAARIGTDSIGEVMLDFSWQLICLITLLALIGITMLLVFVLLKLCGILRNRSEYMNHMRANVAVERLSPGRLLQRLFFPDTGTVYLQPGSISTTPEHHPVAGTRFAKYQTEIDSLEGGRTTMTNNRGTDVGTEDNDTRVQPLTLGSLCISYNLRRVTFLRRIHLPPLAFEIPKRFPNDHPFTFTRLI